MLQNPESFENDPNHLGIIVESLLNHSFQEARKGRNWIRVDSKSRLRRELEHDAERHASAGQETWWASWAPAAPLSDCVVFLHFAHSIVMEEDNFENGLTVYATCPHKIEWSGSRVSPFSEGHR